MDNGNNDWIWTKDHNLTNMQIRNPADFLDFLALLHSHDMRDKQQGKCQIKRATACQVSQGKCQINSALLKLRINNVNGNDIDTIHCCK